MGKLFNYGKPVGKGGWETTSLLKADSAEQYITSDLAASERPNIAIPSPYARLELYRAAFNYVANNKGDEEYYYTLVSDVLDVLEYVFEGKQDGIVISSATLGEIFDNLKEVGKSKHRQSLETYAKVLSDYSKTENFGFRDDEQRIFFFTKKGKVLAMTSPTSILMPTPNAHSEAGKWAEELRIEGSIPLFTKTRALKERDDEFVKYILALYDSICEVDTLKSFADYIAQQKKLIDIDDIPDLSSFSTLSDNDGYDVVAAEDIQLYKVNPDAVSDKIYDESELVLKPTKSGEAVHTPLILTTNNTRVMVYTSKSVKWDNKNSGIDYNDETLKESPITDRTTLPNGTTYDGGFIYEHDFLADVIFQLNYPLSKDFFNGNIKGDTKGRGYIPPVTEEYFKYFDKSDLQSQMSMEVRGKSVIVTLTLPTSKKNGKITLKKTYILPENNDKALCSIPDSSDEAKGYIFVGEFALSLFPKVRFAERELNHYILQLMIGDFVSMEPYPFELKMLVDNAEGCEEVTLPAKQVATVRKENGVPIATNYSIQGSTFDIVKMSVASSSLEDKNLSALLIPIFGEEYKGGSSALSFGFDFGTSNSFIAVVKDNNNGEQDFIDFTLPVNYLVTTYDNNSKPSRDYEGEINHYKLLTAQSFFPRTFKGNPFPTATVLAEPKDNPVNEYDEAIPLLKSSIPFMYGRGDYGEEHYMVNHNLKWFLNGDSTSKKIGEIRATDYINELLMLAQIFAVQQGADLSRCKMTWTYPLSMNQEGKNIFDSIWENAYKTYFGGSNSSDSVIPFTESMAPMIYYASTHQMDYTGVSIDIGGGTCDIVLVPDGEPKESILSSIGFGADCIFAIDKCLAKDVEIFRIPIERFSKAITDYKPGRNVDISNIEATKKELKNLAEKEVRKVTPVLFSLESRPELSDISKNVSYNGLLQGVEHHHSVFIYYYSAIMYYMAKMMKTLPEAIPHHPEKFFFSGSGSKMLYIFTRGSEKILTSLTTDMFNHFLDGYEFPKGGDSDIKVVFENKEPKQITAKGAITQSDANSQDVRNAISKNLEQRKSKFRLLSVIDNNPDERLTYGLLSKEEVKQSLVDEIIAFHKLLSTFFVGERHNEAMHVHYIELPETTVRKYVDGEIKEQLRNNKEETDYNDVPFFLIVKRIISEVLRKGDDE